MDQRNRLEYIDSNTRIARIPIFNNQHFRNLVYLWGTNGCTKPLHCSHQQLRERRWLQAVAYTSGKKNSKHNYHPPRAEKYFIFKMEKYRPNKKKEEKSMKCAMRNIVIILFNNMCWRARKTFSSGPPTITNESIKQKHICPGCQRQASWHGQSVYCWIFYLFFKKMKTKNFGRIFLFFFLPRLLGTIFIKSSFAMPPRMSRCHFRK